MTILQNQPIPVLVDTDGGVDDALALIMALNSPQLDIKAITVLAGNIHVDQAANNVLRILSIVQPNTLPIVAKGCEKPLFKKPFNAAGIHGADGLGELNQFKEADGTACYPKLTLEASTENAIDVILKTAQEYGDSLNIVALGPLTNLATAIQKDAATMKKIGRIIIADRRDRRDKVTNPPNVEACLDVDTERFLKLFDQLV